MVMALIWYRQITSHDFHVYELFYSNVINTRSKVPRQRDPKRLLTSPVSGDGCKDTFARLSATEMHFLAALEYPVNKYSF